MTKEITPEVMPELTPPKDEEFSMEDHIDRVKSSHESISLQGCLKEDGHFQVVIPDPRVPDVFYRIKRDDILKVHDHEEINFNGSSYKISNVIVKNDTYIAKVQIKKAKDNFNECRGDSCGNSCNYNQDIIDLDNPSNISTGSIQITIQVDCPKCGCYLADYSRYVEDSSRYYVGAIVSISYNGSCYNRDYCNSGRFDWRGTVSRGKIIRIRR